MGRPLRELDAGRGMRFSLNATRDARSEKSELFDLAAARFE